MTEDEKKSMQFLCGQNAALAMMLAVLFQSVTLALGKSPDEFSEELSTLAAHFTEEEAGESDAYLAGLGKAFEAVGIILKEKPGYSS